MSVLKSFYRLDFWRYAGLWGMIVLSCCAIFPSGLVSASENMPTEMNTVNDILYYDENDCVDGTDASNQTCVAVSGDQMTWIGDSYSVFVDNQGLLEKNFPGVDIGQSPNNNNTSYIQGSKFVSAGSEENPSCLTILEGLINSNKLRPYLVLACGTNGGWNKSSIDQFKELLDGRETKVVVVNSRFRACYDGVSCDPTFAESNKLLKELADSDTNVSLADWASVYDESYFNTDPVHPYDDPGGEKWVETIKSALPKSCSSGTLCGSTAKEKYWSALKNHFGAVPAAGIMGNIMSEGGFNPVTVESCTYLSPYDFGSNSWTNGWTWDRYYNNDYSFNNSVTGVGSFGITIGRSDYLKYINSVDSDLLEYFKDPGKYSFGGCSGLDTGGAETGGDALMNLIGEADFDKLVDLEVEYMYDTLVNHWDFDLEGYKSETDVRSASDYFASKYERCSGCLDAGSETRIHRANNAESAYSEFKDVSCSTASGTNTGFSTTADLGGTANVTYDAEDGDIEKLLKFAIWEAGQSERDYKDVLSGILDEYEKSGEGERGSTQDLMKYVTESDKFSYRKDYDEKYDTIMLDVTIESEQKDAADDIIKNGIRTTTGSRVMVTDGKDSNTNYCSDSSSKKASGAKKIAETAALMSWPVQDWQTMADDYTEKRVGYCDGGGDNWVKYEYDTEPCMSNPRELYKENWNTFPGQGWYDTYMDCGYFVSTVLHYLDVADMNTTYKMTGQPTMAGANSYYPGDMRQSEDWQEIENTGEDAMKPGDVLIDDYHVLIYVGEEYGGEYGRLAHASRDTRVGEIGDMYSDTRWRIYRYVGDKLGGSGDCDEYDGGEAIACVAESVAWPADDWDKAMAGEVTDAYKEIYESVLGHKYIDNDVSCSRFVSIVIMASGVDSGWGSEVKRLGGTMEGYFQTSPNWEDVTGKEYQPGDIFVDFGTPHVWVYIDDGTVAEGAADSGYNGVNRGGVLVEASPKSANYPYSQGGVPVNYRVFRVKS